MEYGHFIGFLQVSGAVVTPKPAVSSLGNGHAFGRGVWTLLITDADARSQSGIKLGAWYRATARSTGPARTFAIAHARVSHRLPGGDLPIQVANIVIDEIEAPPHATWHLR